MYYNVDKEKAKQKFREAIFMPDKKDKVVYEMQKCMRIMALAGNDHGCDVIDEEFNKLSLRLKNQEITKEEFYEECELLQMAMKMVI